MIDLSLIYRLVLLVVISASGAAQASNSCATVDANLNANIPCVAIGESFYQVTLNRVNSDDPSGLAWNLGSYAATSNNDLCSSVDSIYSITISCVSVDGNDYKVKLDRNSYDLSNFQWFLGEYSHIGVTGAPKFDGIIFSTANNVDQVTIAWLDAIDDKTPISEIKYNIYVSDIADFTPSSSTFSHTVIGAKKTTISGLAAGKTYYIRVIAIDSDGLMSSGDKYATVTTLLNPVILSKTTSLYIAENNNLASPTIVGSEYRFPYTGTEEPPAEDSIIVGADSDGGYLRKVVKSAIDGDKIIVQTTDGSLTDVVHQGSIKTSLTLFDNSTASATTINPLAKALKSSAINSNISSNNISNKIEWQDNLLKFEEIINPNQVKDLVIERNALSGQYLINTTTSDLKSNAQEKQAKSVSTGSISESLSFDVDAIYIPILVTDLDWKLDTSGIHILKGDIKASGVFNLDITANYNFTANGSFTKDVVFDIFKKKWTSLYFVGEVPVYQEITYTLGAHINAKALSAIKGRAFANSFQSITFGVHYNPATKEWEPISNQSHHDALTANLNVMGEIDSEIRLIPNVEVKFYKIVAANLSVEPAIISNIQEEIVVNADFLNGYFPPGIAQLTAFDVWFKEQCFVGANLQIISKEFPLLSKTQVCDLPYQIFSLPVLELTSSNKDSEYLLTAKIIDTENNLFNDASIQWIIYPKDAGTLIPSGRTATFIPSTTTSSDIATIFFSGFGSKLGEFGRQFVQAKVPIETKIDLPNSDSTECIADPNRPGMYWEVKKEAYGLRGIVNSYNWYEPDPAKNYGYSGKDVSYKHKDILEAIYTPEIKGEKLNYFNECDVLSRLNFWALCNTHDYINIVNEIGLCGYHDWRLPKRTELNSLRIEIREQARIYGEYWVSDFINSASSASLAFWKEDMNKPLPTSKSIILVRGTFTLTMDQILNPGYGIWELIYKATGIDKFTYDWILTKDQKIELLKGVDILKYE